MHLRRVKKAAASHKLRIRNEQSRCCYCGEPLNLRSTTERNITNLIEKVKMSLQVGYCQTEDCKNYKVRLTPVSYQTQIVPHSGYGIDVYGLIGSLRFENRQTIAEIGRKLETDYAHIEIKERHIENIVNNLELYISQSGKNAAYLKTYYAKRGQTELILSADGVQPEQGHNILYIIRETISGQILFAHYSTHSDEAHLKSEIIAPLQATLQAAGLKVGGWLVDKELALSKAILALYKETPLQHCQSHFLSALKKPLTQADTELGKKVKKTLVNCVP